MSMYPGMMHWWRARKACGPSASAHAGGSYEASGPGDDELGGGAFGVRRPLRFLAWKLGLSEPQVGELAAVLNELKTERAQAAVDDRRARTAFADLIAGDTLDEAKLRAAADARVKSAEQLRDAVVRALGRIHALLSPEQRGHLAYLIRTGTLTI